MTRTLKPETLATLEQLTGVAWFARVGEKDLTEAVVLTSWEAAVTSALTPEWENTGLEASNRLRERLLALDKGRFNQWNEIAEAVKAHTSPLVERKLAAYGGENLPKAVMDCAKWDILGLGMEAEYADLVPPGFYHALGFYYLRGHFPCGIEGEAATGRMIVF